MSVDFVTLHFYVLSLERDPILPKVYFVKDKYVQFLRLIRHKSIIKQPLHVMLVPIQAYIEDTGFAKLSKLFNINSFSKKVIVFFSH